MIWEVEWSAAAEEQLLGLRRWRDAERVAVAVHRFAATGIGKIEQIPNRPREFRLFVEPFVLRCSFEPSVPSVRVWALYEKR
jgi:hypothetical protein